MTTPRWLISRRTMLRGLGVSMALPLLNVMIAPNGHTADPAEAAMGKVVPLTVGKLGVTVAGQPSSKAY